MRALALLVLLGSVFLGGGCGDEGGGAEARGDLTESLGFLRTEYGLDESQVRCVIDEVEEDLGSGELDEMATAMRSIDEGQMSIDDLEPDQGRVLTSALITCAAVSE